MQTVKIEQFDTKNAKTTTMYPWRNGHSTSIKCLWGVRCGRQWLEFKFSKSSFTHIYT